MFKKTNQPPKKANEIEGTDFAILSTEDMKDKENGMPLVSPSDMKIFRMDDKKKSRESCLIY
jgi:hypothetical protein